MNDREYKAIIEGLLYLWGDPLDIQDIQDVLNLPRLEVRRLLQELTDEQEHRRSGLVLKSFDDHFQLVTRQEHAPFYAKLAGRKKTPSLSRSALETLAIVAYKQPVTRVEVDHIRGVHSSSSIDTLVGRGLIEEAGRLDQVGRPIIYRTTIAFLQHFDMASLDELPQIEELDELTEDLTWEALDED